MDTLAKLFGSAAKVKTLKLFLFNPGEVYENKDVAKKAKVSSSEARSQISLLKSIGLLRKKSAYRDIPNKKKNLISKKRIYGYTLEEDFHYLVQLRGLLGSSGPESFKMVENKLKGAGRMKLIILSGFFIEDLDSRVDLLIVGDHLKKKNIENIIKTIESEIGRELRYSIFETAEFQYRISIYDRLVRDILDYPHHKVLNRLGI